VTTTLSVNGKTLEYSGPTTLGALVDHLGIRRDGIAVAVNDDVVPRAQLDVFAVRDGDAVEVIVAAAGG